MKKTKARTKLMKRIVACATILALVLAFTPFSASATAGYTNKTWSTAIELQVGVSHQVGEMKPMNTPSSDEDQRFFFNVTVPSVVVMNLSTEESADGRQNNLYLQVMYADANDGIYDINCDGISYPQVESTKQPLSKDFNYKLMPGKYYVKVHEMDAINCYGHVMLKSITPAKQTMTKDSYTVTQGLANPAIELGKTYDGLINYRSKLPDGKADSYGMYAKNYYKMVLNATTTLKVTATRADAERDNNISIKIYNKEGTDSGVYDQPEIKLDKFPTGTAVWKDVPKGTYLILVDGWPANANTTEYTLKVEEQIVKLTSISLNKTKLTLKKGSKFTLEAKSYKPADTSAKFKTLKFKTSNKKVASVSSKGVIKGVKKGKATITVTDYNGKTYKCAVTVK